MIMTNRTCDIHKPHGKRSRPLAVGGFVLCLALMAGGAARGGEREPLRSEELLPGITVTVHADGALELVRPALSSEPLLTADLSIPEAGRLRRTVEPEQGYFLGRAAEGCPGGLRGFSAAADDDGDGLVDEDRLDGRDNDRDGRVDEDFAAISDAMIAVTLPAATGGGHLEYYHWGQPRLQGVVFAAVSGAVGTRWMLTTGGTAWQEASLATVVHSATGRPVPRAAHAFVSRVDAAADCRKGGRWLGVVVLDTPAAGRIGRALVDGQTLAVAIGDEPLAVAVCAAESWLQLVRLVNEAARVREGVTDPVDGSQAPWIVAPACPSCRAAATPAPRWRLDQDGDLVLAMTLGSGAQALPDPDLLQLGDHRLGAPARLAWAPADGAELGVAWSCAQTEGLQRGAGHTTDPYALLEGIRSHGATGTLELRFIDPAPELLRLLSGGASAVPQLAVTTLDGRRVLTELQPDVAVGDPVRSAVAMVQAAGDDEPTSPARQSQLLRSGRTRAQLAPELLQGWPNPFRDVISVRFRVPVTIGEAFAWDDDEDRPAGIDPAAAVPWRQGAPEATVKIYTMSGQEVTTLFGSPVIAGEVTVSWDGSDGYGRKVASGTYFCKLQLDEWSVTRRLVYLR